MANYSVNDFTEKANSLAAVLALLETKLETLDSTNNPIHYIDVFRTGQVWHYALITKA